MSATPPGQPGTGQGGRGRDADLEAIGRDLDRLGELTGPFLTSPAEDLSAAAARIPDEDQRREAGQLLRRLRAVLRSRPEGPGEAGPGHHGAHRSDPPR